MNTSKVTGLVLGFLMTVAVGCSSKATQTETASSGPIQVASNTNLGSGSSGMGR